MGLRSCVLLWLQHRLAAVALTPNLGTSIGQGCGPKKANNNNNNNNFKEYPWDFYKISLNLDLKNHDVFMVKLGYRFCKEDNRGKVHFTTHHINGAYYQLTLTVIIWVR